MVIKCVNDPCSLILKIFPRSADTEKNKKGHIYTQVYHLGYYSCPKLILKLSSLQEFLIVL